MSLDEVRALVERYLPSFIAGERAPADCYADKVVIWHNIGEREEVMSAPPSFGRAREAIADLRREDVSVHVFDGGFVIQATTVGNGSAIRVPACLIVRVERGRITRFEEYADSTAAAAFLQALSAHQDREGVGAFVTGVRDDIVGAFAMRRVEDVQLADVGSFGVWIGEQVRRLAHVGIALPDGSMEAHMLVAQTPAGSAVPHLGLDVMRFPSGFAVFVDLLPRVDLISHRDYMQRVYEGLDEVAAAVGSFDAVPMPPSMLAYYSPWMLHFTGAPTLQPIEDAARAFIGRFADLARSGIEVDISSTEIAERDRRHRAVLFDPDFDPVWKQVEPLLGAANVTLIRETLGAPL